MHSQTTVPSKHTRIGRWRSFYTAVHARGASFLSRTALPRVAFKGAAIDIGAGAMNDSKYFLESGFASVVALDGSPDSRVYAETVRSRYGNRFEFIEAVFDGFPFESFQFDLVHANFSLPFSKDIRTVIARTKQAVRDSGIYSATFYGPSDCRRAELGFTAIGCEELALLFADFKTEIQPISIPGYDGVREYYRVIAQKFDDAL